MKVSRLAVLAAMAMLVGSLASTFAADEVRIRLSDYRVLDPLEYEITEIAVQEDEVPLPPNGTSPSDVPVPEMDGMPVPAGVGGACKGKGLVDGCCCGSPWTVGVDAVFLTRDTSNRELQFYNVDGAAAARVPDFDYEPGYRITAVYCHPCGDDIEISYMNLDHWDGGNAEAGTVDEYGFDFYGEDTLNDVSAFRNRYESDLDNLEINFRRCCGNMTLIYGFRYIDIDELLVMGQDFTLGYEEFRTVTSNRLFGLQVGAETTAYQSCRLCVNVFGKAGVYVNDHDQNSTWDFTFAEFEDSDQQIAFVGELGVVGRYCLCNGVSIRGGYQAFWISDVATAPAQIDSVDLTFVPAEGAIATEDVLFHGGFLGVEFCR